MIHSLRVTLALAIGCFSVCGCGEMKPPAAIEASRVSLSLASNTGEVVTLPLGSARATVLDFFSPSCEPCQRMLPAIVAHEAAIEAKGAKLVLIAVLADGESTADAQEALANWGVPHAFLVDSGDTSQRQAGVAMLPTSLVLDPTGAVLFRGDGTTSPEDVLAHIP